MFENYTVYKRLDKRQNRFMVMLYDKTTKHRTTMSYARYLMVKKLGRPLDKDLETVDHINGDTLDDRLENLQLLTRQENILKSVKPAKLIELICPVCKIKFHRRRGQTHLVKGGDSTCCSRRCGGIKSHF